MPAINFKKQFVPMIENGKKQMTIRKMRKRPFMVGDKLYLKSGSRFKPAALGEATVLGACQVIITDNELQFGINFRF